MVPDPLSPDLVAQLLPLLEPLASLLARRSRLDPDEAATLLLRGRPAGQHELVTELARWALLLQGVWGSHDTGTRDAAVEALILRGVPRDVARQAVLVATGAIRPTPEGSEPEPKRSDGRIVDTTRSRSYRTLDEALRAAQPGAVLRIPAGRHVLEVGRSLDAPITLLGDGAESTEIVAARGEIVLAYEGSGAMRLQDLTFHWVGDAEADAHLVHLIADEVQVQLCRFLGAPWSATWIGVGLALAGHTRVSVQDCLFQDNGCGLSLSANVRAEVTGNTFERSRVAGLVYHERSGGTAADNRCERASEHGILVGGESSPTLERNVCRHNAAAGIVCADRTTARLHGNVCAGNATMGIHVADRARPTLDDNRCTNNGQCGIAFLDHSGGRASRNVCSDSLIGIYIDRDATPVLDDNTVSGNRRRDLEDHQRRRWWRR